MATQKPRITITLEQDVYDTIRGLSDAQGVTMSGLVSEFLSMVNPVQQRVLRAVKKAQALDVESKAGMVASLEASEAQLAEMLGPLLALMDRAAEGQPPHSNTGVTHSTPPAAQDEEKPLNPSIGAGSGRKSGAQKPKNIKAQKTSVRGSKNDA